MSALSGLDRRIIQLQARIDSFLDRVDRELASTRNGSPGTRLSLSLFSEYAQRLRARVLDEQLVLPPNLLVTLVSAYSNHFAARQEFFDDRFGRANSHLPHIISACIDHECRSWSFVGHESVVTVGQPGNFTTLARQLRSALFDGTGLDDTALQPLLLSRELVMIAAPEIEAHKAAYLPITVGHEFAHYAQHKSPVGHTISLIKTLDSAKLDGMIESLPESLRKAPTKVRGFEQIALRWLNELVCDAYAVLRFGPAGVAALGDFLEYVGAHGKVSDTHPPASLRLWLMNDWVKSSDEWQQTIIGPYGQPGDPIAADWPDWTRYLSTVFQNLSDEIWQRVKQWAPIQPYSQRSDGSYVQQLAAELDAGKPCSAVFEADKDMSAGIADIVNACWLAIASGSKMPVDRLALKALDTIDFLRLWNEAGGSVSSGQPLSNSSVPRIDRLSNGVLSSESLRDRLSRTDGKQLVITPLLQDADRLGAGIDVRLGTGFIIFERTSAASFDALSETQQPASMQRYVQKAWGDVFYLHPGQLVLAATLEYLMMPNDLTAQVITRSSYGRLGLLCATAIQVHPGYAGCLTLELENLGEMPLTLTPGERVAQLIFSTTTDDVESSPSEKYRYPTEPEFSKIRNDHESRILRGIRNAWMGRGR